jgi:hypothetical protein
VEKVLVGGDENYSPDKWIPADTEVIIYYHTFPNDTEIVADSDVSSTQKDSDGSVNRMQQFYDQLTKT